METLGAKIRKLRKAHNLTQQDLADGMVTPSMISQIESGRAIPSVILLQHIAKRLNVGVELFESEVMDKSDEIQMYRTARNLMEARRYEEALEYMESLGQPLSPQFKPEVVYNEMATCNLHLKRLEKAWRLYEKVVQVGYEKNDVATSAHAYHNVATTLKRLGKNKIARMYWQRANDLLHQHPDSRIPVAIKISFNLGRMYLEEGNWSRAKSAYEEAILLSNRYGGNLDFAKTYHGLACACAQLKEYDDALTYNDRAIAAHVSGENPLGALKCRFNRGVILRAAGRYQEAQGHFTQLRAIFTDKEPLFQALLHEISWLAWRLGDEELALSESAFALGLKSLPDVFIKELRMIRANIFLQQQRYDAALTEAMSGVEVHLPANSASHYQLEQIIRECRLRLGQANEVIESCIAEAQQISPTTRDVASIISA